MKKIIKYSVMALFLAGIVYSCDKDEEEKVDMTPEISNVNAKNHDGGDTIALNGTISVDFDAKTRSGAKLDYYHIEIHDHPASGMVEDEYKIIDSTFKNDDTFKGLKNAHIHKHINVPDTANIGPYHVVIIVVDEDGNSSDTEELETHIEIVE